MLERTAKCLKSGLLQPSCLCPTNSFQARRMLHSAFWRHGAGDLDLPTWCFQTMRALFEPEIPKSAGDHVLVSQRISNESASTRGTYLDFLYPPETQAIIKRISRYGLRRWHRQLRSWTSDTTARQFMSAARLDKQAGRKGKASHKGPQGPSREMDQDEGVDGVVSALSQKDALRRLEKLIATHQKGEYKESWKEAWELFSTLDMRLKSPQLIIGLMSLLATSPRALDTRRVVRLFDSLPAIAREQAAYYQVLQALLKLKEPGKAVMMHETALSLTKGSTPVQGTDILLAHLVANRQWQLVQYTYDNCMTFFRGNETASQTWRISFFEKLQNMPDIEGRIMSLLSAITAYPQILPARRSHFRDFLGGMVDSIVANGRGFGAKRNRQVVEIMTRLGLGRRQLYEQLGLRTLESLRGSPKARTQEAMRIYQLYSEAQDFNPSQRLLHTLVKGSIDADDQKSAFVVVSDWYRFHGLPTLQLTGLLMKGSSRDGDIEKVTQLLQSFLRSSSKRSLKLFYPLLHVHALRAEPQLVEQEMGRMKQEFDYQPDVVCWNILLHAHQRAGDLDGALSTLSKLLEAGITPDHYSFGTIMAISADRGDVEFCEQMLDLAQTYNTGRSAAMNDCLVLAYLNNEQPKKAEVIAHKLTLTPKSGVKTRMWNQILAYHCLNRRPDNLRQTLRVARLMQKLSVPFDALTYSAIMRAYAVKRRTDMARRILHRVIMRKELGVLPFHFAIVIDGYAAQLNFEKGLRMHAEMLELGIKPDISSEIAMQKLHALAAERKYLVDGASHTGLRFDVLDESLEENLAAYDSNIIAGKTPQLYSTHFNSAETLPAAYFDLPLTLYSKIRAYDVVKTLFEKYETAASTLSIPLRFMATVMNLHYRAGDHESIDALWTLACTKATASAKTASRTTQNVAPYIAPTRRTLLARHLDILLRSLDARGGSGRQSAMQHAITTYFSDGFDLDNRNWNLYVQLLATRGDHLAAFSLCERHLMPRFPGWRADEPRARMMQATHQKSPGTEFMGGRYTFLKRGELRVSFKTMVRFAFVVRGLRSGAPFDLGMQETLAELEKEAPRTLQAVLQMPMVEHPAATHVLGARARSGQRRSLGV